MSPQEMVGIIIVKTLLKASPIILTYALLYDIRLLASHEYEDRNDRELV